MKKKRKNENRKRVNKTSVSSDFAQSLEVQGASPFFCIFSFGIKKIQIAKSQQKKRLQNIILSFYFKLGIALSFGIIFQNY